jgi:hypothetical protein
MFLAFGFGHPQALFRADNVESLGLRGALRFPSTRCIAHEAAEASTSNGEGGLTAVVIVQLGVASPNVGWPAIISAATISARSDHDRLRIGAEGHPRQRRDVW